LNSTFVLPKLIRSGFKNLCCVSILFWILYGEYVKSCEWQNPY